MSVILAITLNTKCDFPPEEGAPQYPSVHEQSFFDMLERLNNNAITGPQPLAVKNKKKN
jgi:hypothetical protein